MIKLVKNDWKYFPLCYFCVAYKTLYLQELNTIAIDQYTNLSHSATQIKDSLHDLDVKYKLLLPYLEQLNQLGKIHPSPRTVSTTIASSLT